MLQQQHTVSARICLFIDGLDELDGDPHGILNFLTDLVAVQEDRTLRFQACVAGRKLKIFEHGLRPFPQLAVQDLTSGDIETYVTSKLSNHHDLDYLNPVDEAWFQFFARGIVSKASGVFLWVRLAVKSLEDGLEMAIPCNIFREDSLSFLRISRVSIRA